MKLVIFAGGTGTRLWPLSRRNSPKQFEKLKGDKSTLQMAIDRIESFGLDNVFISTNKNYVDLVQDHVQNVKKENILAEPDKRDLAAAVGLTLMRLKKQGASGTVAILWADHFMDHPERFRDALNDADALVKEDPNRIIFLGENPSFANHNLGWIHTGEAIKDNQHKFVKWAYRPELSVCKDMFEGGKWLWNPGYFVFDIDFVLNLYKTHMSDMHNKLELMAGDECKTKEMYSDLQSISFDEAIIEKIDPHQAVVLKVDLGWSDPGTLYALKEALEPDPEKNFTKGLCLDKHVKDSLIYNEEENKLVSVIGLEGVTVINTKDALLVCHKDKVPNIKDLLKKIEDKGLENYL
jgi:mannose-1-phosphate guanylyltransferase